MPFSCKPLNDGPCKDPFRGDGSSSPLIEGYVLTSGRACTAISEKCYAPVV